MTERLCDKQKVEILVSGVWVPATFHSADSISPSDPEFDELWWMDYFQLENGDTIPEDITSGGDLPPWRQRKEQMRCIVKGCMNHFEAGTFMGELCSPCHEMLSTGEVHPKNITFIGDLHRVATMLKTLIDEMTINELMVRLKR